MILDIGAQDSLPLFGTLDADETDGAELTLYVWREFCDSPAPPPISAPSVHEIIERLKVLMPAGRY
jgi:hypothetical protein